MPSQMARRSQRRRSRGRATAANELGRMHLSIPAGELDPNSANILRISVSGWQVRNDGDVTGVVGPHIIVQERGGFLGTQEISIIEGDWVEGASPFQARLRVRDLEADLSASAVRRAIRWEPLSIACQPGIIKNVTFSITIGMDLIAGKRDLDVVAIIDRLPEGDGIAERRHANAFSIGDIAAPAGFLPTILGDAQVQVFPQ